MTNSYDVLLSSLATTNYHMMELLKIVHKTQAGHTEFGCPLCKPFINLSEENRDLFMKLKSVLDRGGSK